jgi:hypothetical protein
MRPVCTTSALFRVVLAVAFGFMSLGHAPVMAFAKTHQSTAVVQAEHQHHQAAPRGQHDPAQMSMDRATAPDGHDTQCPAVCSAIACFVMISPAAAGAPASLLLLPLGKLLPEPARAMLPAGPDPLLPPPRLQV